MLTGDNPVDNNDLPDKQEVLLSFFPYCKEELGRKGVTRQILWGEYKTKHPDGYSYSQFCELLGQWLHNTDASLHIEQQAGDKMYVDFAGSHLSIVDTDTGEVVKFQSKDFIIMMQQKPELRDQIYKKICETTILQYKKDTYDIEAMEVDTNLPNEVE